MPRHREYGSDAERKRASRSRQSEPTAADVQASARRQRKADEIVLAYVCERARLSAEEAGALLRTLRGEAMDGREEAFEQALAKLRQAFGHLFTRPGGWYYDLLECLANVHQGSPTPPLVNPDTGQVMRLRARLYSARSLAERARAWLRERGNEC